MSLPSFTNFIPSNRRLILWLAAGHLMWSCAVFGLWWCGQLVELPGSLWSGGFIALQLFAAAQLLLPVLLLQPEERNRFFYLFWAVTLLLSIWLINQLSPVGGWQSLLAAVKSSHLLLVATLIGAALARYVQRLWEIVPVCIVMTLADLGSWLGGPTAGFSREIQHYYLAPEGPPPLIDMFLVKLVITGPAGLAPVFGISDWIMVAFFAIVAHRYAINDNLIGSPGETLARQIRICRYLPVSVVALFVAIVLAHATGLFIPALPLMALVMFLWYAVRLLLRQRPDKADDF